MFLIFLNLSGADEGGHDAHVRRQEELQTHDEDGEDGEGQQLETVIHQLWRQEFTPGRHFYKLLHKVEAEKEHGLGTVPIKTHTSIHELD